MMIPTSPNLRPGDIDADPLFRNSTSDRDSCGFFHSFIATLITAAVPRAGESGRGTWFSQASPLSAFGGLP
jgi:hypothetical protein